MSIRMSEFLALLHVLHKLNLVPKMGSGYLLGGVVPLLLSM